MTAPQRFQTRSLLIEAMPWPVDGDNPDYRTQRDAVHRWISDNGGQTDVVYSGGVVSPAIVTTFGPLPISPADWVILIEGHFYPVKPEIFTALFEAVS